MSGRRLLIIVMPLALLVAALVLRQSANRWRSSLLAVEVQSESYRTAATGRPTRAVLMRNLGLIAKAETLDPANAMLPMLRGSQHLMLRDPHAAIRAYRESLALEPRAEIYNNLGRAYLMAGDEDQAAAHFETAIKLDRHLRPQLESFLERRRRATDRGVERDRP